MTKRVLLISGSRDMVDDTAIRKVFSSFNPDMVIHGGCRGADTLVNQLAKLRGVACCVHPYIDKMGPSGGPIRNCNMVEQAKLYADAGCEVLTACFPGPLSKGTWDLCRKAKAAGLVVTVFEGER